MYLMNWLQSLGLSLGWAQFIMLIVKFACIAGIIVINILILIWLERKIAGFIQQRLGPNRLRALEYSKLLPML